MCKWQTCARARARARHSFEDETMRTGDTVSCERALGVDPLVHDQLLPFRGATPRNETHVPQGGAHAWYLQRGKNVRGGTRETGNFLDKDLI